MSHDYFNDDEDEEDEVPSHEKEKKKKDKIIWSRSPNWNEVFGGNFFKDFEVPDIEKMVRKIMEQLDISNNKNPSDGPVVWGFSMSLGADKKPIFRQFGNLNPKQKKKLIQEKREPLVDVIEEEKEITIIAEVPGVTKADINLDATETVLKLSVNTPKRKYFKEIFLPNEVIPKSAKARYKNGILEIKMQKKDSDQEVTSIEVE